VFAAADAIVVPTFAGHAVSGGPIETAALDRLTGEIVEHVREHAGSIDAAYICLHGAMAGEDADASPIGGPQAHPAARRMSENAADPEGRLLAEIRALLGAKPLVASLDLHAVLTGRMLAAADLLVPFHTYPHVDQYETGRRAATRLLELLAGKLRPTTVRIELPMLVRGDELITRTGRFGEAIRICQAVEADPRGIAAGVIIGNAFTDVPALQSNVLVTANGDEPFARREALRIARFMWANREWFQAKLTSLAEAIRLAGETQGLTVFSDAADATASGASGDSNAILQGLCRTDSQSVNGLRATALRSVEQLPPNAFAGTALVPIVDAPAVDAASAAGEGATIDITLGGTRDPRRFTPLPVTAVVKSLHEGEFLYEDGTAGSTGGAAVLQVGNCTVLATRRPVYVVGRKVFEAHGLDPRNFNVVVVKSPNGFRTWYEAIAARIVPVDVPGSTSANLKSLPYRHCVRPIFPLDEHVEPNFQ
jgi:microcystin degradation protein MlrC